MVAGVDDFLYAVALAATKEAAQEIGKDLVDTLFSFLPTKVDLQAAVAQLEAFIGQEFADFINDNLVVSTYKAQEHLSDFRKDRIVRELYAATDALDEAGGWIGVQVENDANNLRLRYAEIARYCGANIAAWYNRALINHSDSENLRRRIKEVKALLTNCVNEIKHAECVEVSPLIAHEQYVGGGGDQEGPGHGGPPQKITYYTFDVNCIATGNYHYNQEPIDAEQSDNTRRAAADHARDAVIARYNAGEAQRDKLIYRPVAAFLDAIDRRLCTCRHRSENL